MCISGMPHIPGDCPKPPREFAPMTPDATKDDVVIYRDGADLWYANPDTHGTLPQYRARPLADDDALLAANEALENALIQTLRFTGRVYLTSGTWIDRRFVNGEDRWVVSKQNADIGTHATMVDALRAALGAR